VVVEDQGHVYRYLEVNMGIKPEIKELSPWIDIMGPSLPFLLFRYRLLMFSHMNLLSPAIGDSIALPTQGMLLGSMY